MARSPHRTLLRTSMLSVLPLALLASGCSGDDEPSGGGTSPEDVLAEAKTALDQTSGVKITLASDGKLPGGVNGVSAAEGVGIHPAAFDGTFDLSVSGIPATAEVIAVDGVTYAKNSLLLPDWTEIDPAKYGAPDPAELMSPDGGLSGLLTATTDVEEGESVRGGSDNSEVLTGYTGTVPGTAVEPLLPTATGDFEVTYSVTEDGELREAVITGEFYEGADPVTYTVTLDEYGTEQDITAP